MDTIEERKKILRNRIQNLEEETRSLLKSMEELERQQKEEYMVKKYSEKGFVRLHFVHS